MGQAEEAGQQPSRLSPAITLQAVTAEQHDNAAACGGIAEPGRCEVADEDLAVPGDRLERAKVDNAARLLADRALVGELAAAGFTGPVFDVTRNELAAYGIATLMSWMRTGRIASECLAHGRPLSGAEQVMGRWSRDDRLEIAVEATARALKYFIDKVLRPGKWSHRRGATLRTYFVGACLLQYPNVYELWVTEQKQWELVDLAEPSSEVLVARGHGDGYWADPVADAVIRSREASEILDGIRDPQTRAAAEQVMQGCNYAEAGAAAGLSAAAVEGRLYRLRRRPR